MSDKIQTKITNFSFPSTFDKLRVDPAIDDGSLLLHDFSHEGGVQETSGFDVHRLDKNNKNHIKMGSASGYRIDANVNFEIFITMYLNSFDTVFSLFGENVNSGSFINFHPTGGANQYGHVQGRIEAPHIDFDFDNEFIRTNEKYDIHIKRTAGDQWQFGINGQYYNGDDTVEDNPFDLSHLGISKNDLSVVVNPIDGYLWDFKLKIGDQVGTGDSSIAYSGIGTNAWVNTGTSGAAYDGIPMSDGVETTLPREIIGKDILAYDDTIVNLAETESTLRGVVDTSVVTLSLDDNTGLTQGRGYKLSNVNNGYMRLPMDIEEYFVNDTNAHQALSFWFKPELDDWDNTNIGYFLRWGETTSNYNHWILFNNNSTGDKAITLLPSGTFSYSNYENINSGIVNVILTRSGAWVNGVRSGTSYDKAIQAFNNTGQFSLDTSQHTSQRTITHLYRTHIADINQSPLTEAQWVAREYETGFNFIKAITDSTT